MKLDRVMIAAPRSGSGKTMMTCGLLRALLDMEIQAVSYKCGPDYIDPMFHQMALGIPSRNLDTFFTGEEETKRLFLKNREQGEFAVLEGVMGLFDGLGGIREEGSSYHLAQITQTPIVLVVDAKGMGRSLIPMVAGFLSYDKAQLIKGVILNRMSAAYYKAIRPILEKELGIAVLGYLPEQKELHMESRHLGLCMPQEMENSRQWIRKTAEALKKTVSVASLVEIGTAAPELSERPETAGAEGKSVPSSPSGTGKKSQVPQRPVIAVARDEAFCFYYEDNLELLRKQGAELVEFSPIHDETLPPGCSGILLGGGYPELFARQLSSNTSMLASIRQAAADHMPMVAECGGFLYLHSLLENREKTCYTMAGVTAAACRDTGKLVRFGYIEIREKESRFLPPGESIRGHEFHYFDSENNGTDCVARKPATGKTYPCILAGEDYWFGFPHLYYPSNPSFARCFVEKARQYQKRR